MLNFCFACRYKVSIIAKAYNISADFYSEFESNGWVIFGLPGILIMVAESLGLPFVSPYFGREEAVKGESDFGEGVNFAVAGAGALEDSFLRKRGIRTVYANISLGNQIHWFKQMFASLCQKSTGN